MNGFSNLMTCLGTGLPASRDSEALFEILRGSNNSAMLRHAWVIYAHSTLSANLLDLLGGFFRSRITT
jgi:hypothetical protein